MLEFWFNRLLEYWSLPEADALLEHVRRGRVQVVQMGNFGPDFYGLADDPAADRHLAGMPRLGIDDNLAYAADLVRRVQAAGARVVGQLSMTLHYGDHETGRGLFGPAWARLWTPERLGAAPCAGAAAVTQRDVGGGLRRVARGGYPGFVYKCCIANPAWRAVLRAMVDRALAVGLDGFNATHNYEGFCACPHCRRRLGAALQATPRLRRADLDALFGGVPLDTVADLGAPVPEAPPDLRRVHGAVVEQAAAALRKAAFDEVFLDHGRRQRPGLLLAQWYHKYGMRVLDERAGLSAEQWARGESYLWYSQGPYRWGSSLDQGWLADMGLNARHMRAAGGGRPFVVNKYDYRRWRVWAAEAGAHGGAALAFHAGPPRRDQEDATRIASEDYYGPVIRYQRFLAEHEDLLHPATSWAQVGLVYPRRDEREIELDALDVLKRLAEWLEDAHVLYDLLFDDALAEAAARFPILVLAGVRRLADADVDLLRRHLDAGGALVLAGRPGSLDADGRPHPDDPLSAWRLRPDAGTGIGLDAAARVAHLPEADWRPVTTKITTLDDAELPVYRHLPDDAQGRAFVAALQIVGAGSWVETDAPWWVRLRAWRPQASPALVLHWINYRQDEAAVVEVPLPEGPFQVACRLPPGAVVEAVEWRYPEMRAPETLAHRVDGGVLRFVVPRLIVWGLSVVRLRPGPG